MDDCCQKNAEALAAKQGKALVLVLALNLGMFVVEVIGGVLGRSTALLGDSLDMLGDALAYGATLYVLRNASVLRARATLLKGALMAIVAAGVVTEAISRAVTGVVPSHATIGLVGAAALAVNAGCLVILLRHRNDDSNLKSAWACSRNDLVANVMVLGAGAGVALSGSWWPDALVGFLIAALYLVSSVAAILAGSVELRHANVKV
jgi:Co/Zn/Cd efflux system component